ncbi:MAG TPA: lysylphosphatidylglycerol synthase domain-containing protein [Gemmatimonadales bacterium]|nr:lysylphosphatidylglycerol synthase domain-containing protein [Gemmatimonadales bacterium]
MRLSIVEAHLLCLVLVLLDIVARGYRLRWYLHGFKRELSLEDALNATTWGDAAAGLTPLRFGGEAAKLAGLLRGRIPASLSVMTLALEAIITYPLVALVGVWLAWRFAPDWWNQVGPMLGDALAAAWPWILGIIVATVVAIYLGLRWRRALSAPSFGASPDAPPAPPVPSLRTLLAATPVAPLALGAGVSLYNVLARTAVLPILALTLPDHPPLGILLIGSFALLYSQLVLPTPAGVGAVDLGFLAGVAGNLGPEAPGLLLAWRVYTVGIGAGLGLLLALRAVGWPTLKRVVFGRLSR